MEKYVIIGYPHLVRLNPNIPWKTRGNGAVSIQFGKSGKKRIKIGNNNKEDVFSYLEITQDISKSENQSIIKILNKIIEENVELDNKDTNPGIVLLKKKPDIEVYNRSVIQIESINRIKLLLKSLNADYKGYNNCRGLIGATSAIAWTPLKDKTFELISYRNRKKWGTKRYVDPDSVISIDKYYKTTFDSYDFENNHNRIMPKSPCPILYGIRGDDFNDLFEALKIVKSEPVNSWLIFETNQGTDDHLVKKNIADIQPYQSVIARGSVVQNPHAIKGGHVIFSIKDKSGVIFCAAYEPTKKFRNKVRELHIGDIVDVYGGVRKYPLTINIEKFNLSRLTLFVEKTENPICPKCKKHMKSRGKNQGYKCKKCGEISYKPILMEKQRLIHPGFYEVPVCARRHLSKPLKRMYDY